MDEPAVQDLLSVPEVARRLGQSRQTIYRKIAAGELPAVRLGLSPNATLRVPADELADFIYGTHREDPSHAEGVRRRGAGAGLRCLEVRRMTGLEHAAGERVPVRRSPFPREWGDPPGDATEAQIAGWASGQIAWGRALRATGQEVRWLAKTQGVEARARLDRDAMPAIAARLRLLQLHAKHRPPWMLDA